jgi:CheY-like chemotaxis protein
MNNKLAVMVKETENHLQGNTGNIFESIFVGDRKVIERYSYIALFSLITSIIFISFDLRLPAGCFVIIASATGVIVVRKALSLIRKVGESLEEASTSSEKKDDVITDFSHRIREPLNNLVIIGDLLIGSGLQKKQKELLETFIASTNNMVTTVNELTMQTAGNINYEDRKKIRFNLISTIQNTIDLFSLKDSSSIDFILNKRDMNLFEITGDPIILKQIFLDLFNTIESQDSDRMTKISIGLKKLRESNNESFINFRIQTDRDIILIDEKGIPGNLAAKLISSSKGYFHQEFGNGFTVLDFTLPFLNITPEAKKNMASPKLEELKMKDRTRKELKDVNILLVEDNSINQKITLLTLSPLVNNIDTAINGKEALDKFGTSTYDLILMDIQMPVMSGLTAAEKIRALESSTSAHVPIIAITANAMLGDKERCLSAGMDDYISKPFQPAALIEKIKRFV